MKRAFPSGVLLVAMAGGFLGGLVSQGLFQAGTVHAQSLKLLPPGAISEEVTAKRFVLKDSQGTVWGEFKVNGQKPELVLYDRQGRPAWKASTDQLQPLSAFR